MLHNAWLVLLAYALGCIQTGYYLVLSRTGRDLRKIGSGSTGARNTGRVLGKPYFALTLLLDTGKGALAVALTIWLETSSIVTAGALIAVAVGHVWPVQLHFSGGRGVAVGLGALAVLDIRLLGILAGTTLVLAIITRRLQLSGMMGFLAVPFAAWYFHLPMETLIAAALLSILVLVTHRSHFAGWLKPARDDDHSDTITDAQV